MELYVSGGGVLPVLHETGTLLGGSLLKVKLWNNGRRGIRGTGDIPGQSEYSLYTEGRDP